MSNGLCARHLSAQRHHYNGQRDTSYYSTPGYREFREAVLMRDRYNCVICGRRANVADHYPTGRRELEACGADPNDPAGGRALCTECHNRHTGKTEGRNNLGRTRIRDR